MKQCPVCKRAYADDRLGYCLEDGIALVSVSSNLNSAQPPTQPSPRVKYSPAPTERVSTGQFASFAPPSPAPVKAKGRGWIIFAVAALLLAAAAVLGFLALRKVNAPTVSDANANTNLAAGSNSRESKAVFSTTPISTPTPTAAQLVGSWKTSVVENKVPMDITVTFNADGTSKFLFKDKRGRADTDNGTWQYSEGMLYEKYSNGVSGKGSLKWIDEDNVDLTIIDNGVPAYSGVVRHYRRVGEIKN